MNISRPRNIFIFSLVVVVSSLAALCGSNFLNGNPDRSTYLLNAQSKPTPALQSLLQLMNVEHDGSLASIVEKTQKEWLRAAGKERWQIEEMQPFH